MVTFLVFIILPLVFLIFFIKYPVGTWRKTSPFKKGALSHARVVNLWQSKQLDDSFKQDASLYWIDYEYQVEGHCYKNSLPIKSDMFYKLSKGDDIEITYLIDEPSISWPNRLNE
jgi:hypothetical protein